MSFVMVMMRWDLEEAELLGCLVGCLVRSSILCIYTLGILRNFMACCRLVFWAIVF